MLTTRFRVQYKIHTPPILPSHHLFHSFPFVLSVLPVLPIQPIFTPILPIHSHSFPSVTSRHIQKPSSISSIPLHLSYLSHLVLFIPIIHIHSHPVSFIPIRPIHSHSSHQSLFVLLAPIHHKIAIPQSLYVVLSPPPFHFLVSPSNHLHILSISPQYPLAGLSQTFQPETTASERKQPETAQTNRKPQKTTGNRTKPQKTARNNRKPHKTTGNRTKQLYPKQNNLIQHNPAQSNIRPLPHPIFVLSPAMSQVI